MRFFIYYILLSCALPLAGNCQLAAPPIGLWREHLPYNSAIDLSNGDGKVFAATPYSLFCVDLSDNSIERMSRVTGLSETGVSAICYDEGSHQLFIAYENSNIDIIHRSDIINIPDIKRDSRAGDKTVYNIFPYGGYYYLSTGLGVILVDGNRFEIKDTWFISNGGNPTKVNAFAAAGGFFYAATEEGLKQLPIHDANPADHTRWNLLSGTNGLANGPCQQVLSIGERIIVQQNDSLFLLDGSGNWNLFYADGWPIINSNVSEEKILVCQRQPNGENKVVILSPTGAVERVLTQMAPLSFPRKVILVNNEPWVADQFGSLTRFGTNTYEQYKLNSPEGLASGELLSYNNVFYATAGEVNAAWNYQFNGDGIFMLKEGQWININRYRFPQLDSLLDFITIAIDRVDGSAWAGSFGGGLLHIKGEQDFEIYKQGLLQPATGDPQSYRVSGLAFDRDRHLWISNYGATQPLVVRKIDGAHTAFTIPFLLTENALTQLVFDDNDYLWMVAAKGGGLICFDKGASIEDRGDDRWKRFTSGIGSGNLPSAEILTVAKDKNNFIWVGTADGVGVIQCPELVFTSQGCEAIWPVINQGSFAGYLFKGENVRSIAVDGADRKWVATSNGVWLVSATGEQVIYRFTGENSPLLSNDVRKIAIDGRTGEVFFATAKGICSFRSTATEATENTGGVIVFPNPVPPGFSGTIGIRGLPENAIVRITELDGRLVYQGKALGGQLAWNGRDYRGRLISSGAYLVLVSTDGKGWKNTAKIFFIGR